MLRCFSGETGSGKSESCRLAIKMLLELSVSNPPGKKGFKVASQVPTAEIVIESFGNACIHFNPNASCFGKYTELQFTDNGHSCGIKSLDYYLERNRVAAVPSGEQNFHIFYYWKVSLASYPWCSTLTTPRAFVFSKTSLAASSTSWMTRLANHIDRPHDDGSLQQALG